MSWPGGLHHNGMHEFILREAEVGFRVACAEDDEECGFGPLFDLHYEIYCRENPEEGTD